MEIRDAREAEFQTVGELVATAYDAIAGAIHDPEYNAVIRDVEARAGHAVILVAVGDDGAVLGGLTSVAGLGPLAELANGDGDTEVRMFAVASHAQGRGVGRALMSHVIERTLDEGRRRVVLSTSPWMVAAQRLYESLGFRRTPERDHWTWSSGQRFDLFAYELDLTSIQPRQPPSSTRPASSS
jgi:ribosomal protein S18 acetylase RimI-like enzyme